MWDRNMNSLPASLQQPVRKVEEPIPILVTQPMPAVADVVASLSDHAWLVQRGHVGIGDRIFTQQLEDGRCGHQRGILTFWISPQILVSAGHIHAPRGDQADHFMLVDRQLILAVCVPGKRRAEPVGKTGSDAPHRFAIGAA